MTEVLADRFLTIACDAERQRMAVIEAALAKMGAGVSWQRLIVQSDPLTLLFLDDRRRLRVACWYQQNAMQLTWRMRTWDR